MSERTINAVVIRRSTEENTVAIVNAVVADEFATDDDHQTDDVTALMNHIQLAVTQWFDETDQGKEVIRSSSYDFNVGDLTEWKDDESLAPFLQAEGIKRLAIETHCDISGHGWDYDDRLFDELR